jgi:hypothetical protein
MISAGLEILRKGDFAYDSVLCSKKFQTDSYQVHGRVKRSMLDREINGNVTDSCNNAAENSLVYHYQNNFLNYFVHCIPNCGTIKKNFCSAEFPGNRTR